MAVALSELQYNVVVAWDEFNLILAGVDELVYQIVEVDGQELTEDQETSIDLLIQALQDAVDNAILGEYGYV